MRMKVAKYISEFFVKQGVTDMFMITGGAAMHLNDALGHNEGLKVLIIITNRLVQLLQKVIQDRQERLLLYV